MRFLAIIYFGVVLIGCGGDSGSASLSSGLKIFVTSNGHVGDFANDPLLAGSNAIEKADSFCNNDSNKPNGSYYKALLVDGVLRDAPSLTDWVLEPNTKYYRSYGDVEIGTTISTAIFPVLYAELTNSIEDERPQSNDGSVLTNITYTGISNASDFSTDGLNTCNNWTVGTNMASSNWGRIYEKTANSISTNGLIGCAYIAPIYCVEQR